MKEKQLKIENKLNRDVRDTRKTHRFDLKNSIIKCFKKDYPFYEYGPVEYPMS